MNGAATLKPRFGLWLCVIVWGVLALATASIFVQGFWSDLFVYVPAFLLAGWVCWMLFGAPSVMVDDAGVRLANVFRTVSIPWGEIIDVQPGFMLTIRTKHRRHRAWAAPGAAQASTFATLGADQLVRLNLMLPDDGRQVGDALRFDRRGGSADSALAAGYVRHEWEAWKHLSAEPAWAGSVAVAVAPASAEAGVQSVRSALNTRECLIALALVALLIVGVFH